MQGRNFLYLPIILAPAWLGCESRSDLLGDTVRRPALRVIAERTAYYDILESAQRGDLDIRPWIAWFLGCLDRAIAGAGVILASVLQKARFWEAHADVALNDRQRAIVNWLLGDFEGKLTSSKYAKLAKCSQDTAARDIDHLINHGMLVKNPGGGRSTSYSLAEILS